MNTEQLRLLKAALGSLCVATLLLFTVVLPAEYGYDPLGTGRLLGLEGLADQQATGVHEATGSLNHDTVTFELAPYESVEYKYAVTERDTLQFHWRASSEVAYDFHGEPEGAPEGFAETLDRGKASDRRGSTTIPFSGILGWYFENRSFETATVTLQTSGFYQKSYLFRNGFVTEHDFE